MDYKLLAENITNWIKDYAQQAGKTSLVVGVSGGIDSAVVSTLCAMTGLKTITANLRIESHPDHNKLASNHMEWLSRYNYYHVVPVIKELKNTLYAFFDGINEFEFDQHQHTIANTKSRLRMVALYHIAGVSEGLVVGTGNKVEDFGIGFYTKGGDQLVDLSPIGDLYKSEVRELGRYLGISEEILNAKPTDGLFDDNRTDEDQIGCSYEDLEWVMKSKEFDSYSINPKLSEKYEKALEIYTRLNKQNQHKMNPIPVYKNNQ